MPSELRAGFALGEFDICSGTASPVLYGNYDERVRAVDFRLQIVPIKFLGLIGCRIPPSVLARHPLSIEETPGY